jgi:hypothetical protein
MRPNCGTPPIIFLYLFRSLSILGEKEQEEEQEKEEEEERS